MDPLIKVEYLSKIYGRYISRARVTSLRNLNFSINKGERICLFGPNGAGKSTIMKAIMGLVKPTSGRVLINNVNVQQSKIKTKKMIGYLPSDLNFYLTTPCKESLYHFGLLRGLSRKEAKEESERLLETIGLEKWWDIPPKLMSSGMRQRFSLAMAIIGDPEIILFDEPISFIDVQGKMKIYQLVHDYVTTSPKTVIMSTHNIQDALIMSDRLIVMDRGQIIIDGPITEVIKDRCKSMEIILADSQPNYDAIKKALVERNYEISGRKILIHADNALQISIDIINQLQFNGIPIFSYRPFVEQRRMSNEQEKTIGGKQ
ncbi:MAG TPA: ABC transporter ATP-binding protein [Candidatus Bathyarchaeia archaeon]|nr:ABC transporter ATP-binding protein [Candidatus Bathyarchaeia archaeon]